MGLGFWGSLNTVDLAVHLRSSTPPTVGSMANGRLEINPKVNSITARVWIFPVRDLSLCAKRESYRFLPQTTAVVYFDVAVVSRIRT